MSVTVGADELMEPTPSTSYSIVSNVAGARGEDGPRAVRLTKTDTRVCPSPRATNGRVLLNCFAGCPTDEVVAALGLEWSDLFVDDRQRPPGPPRLKRDVGNFRIPRIAGRWGKRNAFFLEWELSRLLASVPKLQAQRDVLQSWDYLAERVDIPLVVGTADYLARDRYRARTTRRRAARPAAAVRFVLRKSSA